eukprot:3480628-Amphidinium_carterae.2
MQGQQHAAKPPTARAALSEACVMPLHLRLLLLCSSHRCNSLRPCCQDLRSPMLNRLALLEQSLQACSNPQKHFLAPAHQIHRAAH